MVLAARCAKLVVQERCEQDPAQAVQAARANAQRVQPAAEDQEINKLQQPQQRDHARQDRGLPQELAPHLGGRRSRSAISTGHASS